MSHDLGHVWLNYQSICLYLVCCLCKITSKAENSARPETTPTPRGLCFNPRMNLEVDDIVWPTCRGDEERGREKERRRAVIHQQRKKGRMQRWNSTLYSLSLQLHHYPLAETFCCYGEANQTYGGTLGIKEGQDIPAWAWLFRTQPNEMISQGTGNKPAASDFISSRGSAFSFQDGTFCLINQFLR